MNALLSRLVACAAVLLLCATAVLAQVDPATDMDAWTTLADRSETAVDDPTTSSTVLEALRAQIVSYRTQFVAAGGANAARIATLRDQLALLGPAPTEGEATVEAPDITENRQELEAQLALLTAPVQVANTAFTRANGLVDEIDRILRARQTQALVEVVASPLNPVHWPVALSSAEASISKLWSHLSAEQAATRRAGLLRNFPLIFFSTIAGLILIARGRRWSNLIVGRLRRFGAHGMSVWRFVVSLLRIVFPFLGLYLLAFAARSTGYLGVRGDELVGLIPWLGGLMLGFRWVADQVFAHEDEDALIELPAKDRREARFYVSVTTLAIIFNVLLMRVLELDGDTIMTTTVISFPFTVIIAIGVFCIGLVLRRVGADTVQGDDEEVTRASTLSRLVRGLGTLSILVAIAAPLFQAAGYYNAATFVLQPTVLTLAILGLVMALQRFGADVYGVITGQGAQAREALIPIFFGLGLLLLAVPALALIWGARVADLTEIWTAFRRGFAIGNSRISPTDFLAFAVIFTVGYLLTRLAQGALKTNVLPKTKIDKGGQNAIVSGVGYVGIFLAALAAITGAGIDLSSLAIVAGALSVGIGFGLQNIVSNFVSGIILLIERPISEGDWIEVNSGHMGFVRDISVRSTRIETFDKTDVIVPNADLVSSTVINYTRGNTLGRVIIPVGVAYGTDTRRVEEILLEIANAQPMALANPPVQVLFLNFGASSLDFEIRIFLRDVTWLNVVKNDVNHEIARRFTQEGIEIPFPQQDVWLRNPESLQAQASTPAAQIDHATAKPQKSKVTKRPDPTQSEEGEQ